MVAVKLTAEHLSRRVLEVTLAMNNASCLVLEFLGPCYERMVEISQGESKTH